MADAQRKNESAPMPEMSLKRAAWAYGCAKKGSREEWQLLTLLWTVIERERPRG